MLGALKSLLTHSRIELESSLNQSNEAINERRYHEAEICWRESRLHREYALLINDRIRKMSDSAQEDLP